MNKNMLIKVTNYRERRENSMKILNDKTFNQAKSQKVTDKELMEIIEEEAYKSISNKPTK